MKKIINCLLAIVLNVTFVQAQSFIPEIKTISLNDGEVIEARLCLPDSKVKTIVFCISGTGSTTYLTKRSTFNYYDELATGFCDQGVAFLTYNRRGCQTSDTPPLFVDVDSVKYAKYTPLQESKDIEMMIYFLMKDPRFTECKILLYGQSEGTIIASLVADRRIVNIDALLLHGYAHENMYDIIRWQDEGNGIMIMANSVFDKNGDKGISKEEYELEEDLVAQYRTNLFHNMSFEGLDVVKNGSIDINDIAKMRMPFHEELMKRVANNDWFWIRSNYFNVTPQWFQQHFELEPNKTRLLRIGVPIHIFHGTDDANVPVESVYDLQSRFRTCNKTNLTLHIFEKHNHDLNFFDWLTDKKWPEGFQQLFNCAGTF